MRRLILAGICVVAAAGCGSTGEKVLQDFGIKDRPEDYQSGADKVMSNLDNVGKVEMDRMNAASRRGEILYDRGDGLTTGAYYKRTKVYENFHPLDASPAAKTNRDAPLSFVGYIEYNYSFYESSRKPTRVEAEAQNADIPAGKGGSETYRYRFDAGGSWTGGKGEPYTE